MKAGNKHPATILALVLLQMGYWALVVSTVAGLLGRYVSPDIFWMLQLAAIMLPYLAWALVATTVLHFILRKKIPAIIHLLLLVLLALRFISFGSSVGDEEAHRLSIVTYNSPYPQTRTSPENEKEYKSILDSYSPNIVAFQETFLGYMIRNTERMIGRGDVLNVFEPEGFEVVIPRRDTSAIFYQPVLTNFPVESSSQVYLRDNPHGLESELLRVRFLWDGRPVVFYNIHLASYGASKPWHEENSTMLSAGFWLKYLRQYRSAIQARAWEVERIRALIDQEEVPVIVAGDFNATRHNWSYQRLRGDLTDVFRAVGEGPRKTYHTRYPFARIDHILVSDDFEPVASRVIKTTRSDHRALWAEIVLVNTAEQ